MDVLAKLDELVAVVESARAVPMSGACVVNRVELLALLDDVRELLPEELRYAELLLQDREAVVEEGRREAARLVAGARAEADRRIADAQQRRAVLVAEQEVLAEADRQAGELLDEATTRAAALRRDADDYADERLADLEVVLNRTLAQVHRGRQRLRGSAGPGLSPAGGDAYGDAYGEDPSGDDPDGGDRYGGRSGDRDGGRDDALGGRGGVR